jgi:hypothetical protein
MTRSPEIGSLFVVRACEKFGGIPTDEASVRYAIDHAPENLRAAVFGINSLVRCAKDSILFAVDWATVLEAAKSVGSPPADLPPLPFRQIIIEPSGSAPWEVEWRDPETGALGEVVCIDAIWLCEISQGEEWQALLFARKGVADSSEAWTAWPMEITAETLRHGYVTRDLKFVKEELPVADSSVEAYWRLAVEAVHFVTARGVSLSEIKKPRAMLRRAERKARIFPPKLYWVTVDDGEIADRGGQSERIYHYRWLVRGHWRQVSGEKRTWVRAYIKGAAGAPWKGRPVYRSEAA